MVSNWTALMEVAKATEVGPRWRKQVMVPFTPEGSFPQGYFHNPLKPLLRLPSTSYLPVRKFYLVPGPSVCHEWWWGGGVGSCAPYPASCAPAILLCLTGTGGNISEPK